MQQQQMFMRPEAIIKYLMHQSEELDTLITCEQPTNLVTTDQSLYEALASISGEYKVEYPRLVKLLEVVEINSIKRWKGQKRSILTPERAEELRAIAGGKKNE